jgi:hypothetical protein
MAEGLPEQLQRAEKEGLAYTDLLLRLVLSIFRSMGPRLFRIMGPLVLIPHVTGFGFDPGR